MAIIIDLGNDQSAVLKDDNELTNREVKQIQRSARSAAVVALQLKNLGFEQENIDNMDVIAQLDEEDYDNMDLFQRTCVIVRLKSWTLDRPIPTTVDEVDDLPRSIYEPLTIAAVNVNFDNEQFDKSPEAQNDPKALTENSGN